MEGKVNYTVVGIFVVVLTALLFVIIFWLTAYTRTQTFKPYLVYVHEDVTGLSVDSPVRFNGVQVGFVEHISLDHNNPKLVRLLLQIKPSVRITTSTYALLNAQGITGVIYVNLKSSAIEAPLLQIKPGYKYPVIPAKPSLLMQLSTVLPEVTKDIQKLSASIAQVLNSDNRQSLSSSLKNIEKFTQTLSNNSNLFQENLNELHKALKNITKGTKDMPEAMRSINTLSVEMKNTAASINKVMKKSNAVVTNFSNQVTPGMQQALSGIHSVTLSMDALLNQLHRNPSILVRGKRPSEPGPGE